MGDAVMPAINAIQKREANVADSIAKHKRTDASDVGLKCQRDHIQHQLNVLYVRLGNA